MSERKSRPASGSLKNTIYQSVTSSSRRLSMGRRLVYAIAVPLARVILRLIWWLCPVKKVIGEEHLGSFIESSSPVIPCYWHQHQLFVIPYLLAQLPRGFKPGFLISPSVDGEAPGQLARSLGGYVIRGSSTRTGARSLRDIFLAITKEGVSPIMAPDGPQGPAFEFKAGPLMLSQLSGAPVIPMAYAARRARVFKTWDRFVLPLPFSKIVIAIGEPVYVDRKLPHEKLASLQQDMAEKLKALFKEARAAL